MAGLLRTQERSPANGELFRLHCVGICGRPSNGQILLDHYRYKRRRFAGDERVCHQSMTAMCWPTARPKAPADERFRVSSPRLLAGSGASWGRFAPKPDKVTGCLAARLHFPDRESFLPGRHLFMVPPGELASPFLSTAPAVPA